MSLKISAAISRMENASQLENSRNHQSSQIAGSMQQQREE
jgi:hypothetical protein